MVNATKEVEAIVLARNVHLAPFVVHENVREKKREKKNFNSSWLSCDK